MFGYIYCLKNGNLKYVGSTTNDLKLRLIKHKSSYKRWTENPRNVYYSSYKVFQAGGPVEIELLERVEYEDLSDLKKREQYYISQGGYVNSIKAYLTEEERKEYVKELRNRRREQEKERSKQHYYCPCGGAYYYFNKNTHTKTKKHTSYIQSFKQEKIQNIFHENHKGYEEEILTMV